MPDTIVFLYVTAPDTSTAEKLARAAVSARLAACANILPNMQSVYRWEGEVQQDDETVILLKTTQSAAPALRALVVAQHPYDTPCITALPIQSDLSDSRFLDWIRSQTEAISPMAK